MAGMIGDILTIVEDVANLLEKAAGQHQTRWLWVRQELNLTDKDKPLEPQNMIPLVRYFTQEKLLGRRRDSQSGSSLPRKFNRSYSSSCISGAGGFGAVYKAYFCNVTACSVKLVPITKFKAEKHACVDKVTASATLHPFLVRYFSTFTTLQAYVTVMEYIRGVDLHKIVKAEGGLEEVFARHILFQLGEAVIHMHHRGFIHRDIKPSNMMIMPGCKIKLIDLDTIKISLSNHLARDSQFYLERAAHEFRDKEQAGTEPFLAPEVLQKHAYGRALDWWAIGVTAFNIAYARIPYRGKKKDREYIKLVSSAPVPYPDDKFISPDFRQFMDDCFSKKPSHRLCSTHGREFREHPFFYDIDFARVLAGACTLDLDSVLNELEINDGRWSPLGVEPKPDQRVTLELTDLTVSEPHSRIGDSLSHFPICRMSLCLSYPFIPGL